MKFKNSVTTAYGVLRKGDACFYKHMPANYLGSYKRDKWQHMFDVQTPAGWAVFCDNTLNDVTMGYDPMAQLEGQMTLI